MKTKFLQLSLIAMTALAPLSTFAADEVSPGKSSTSTTTTEPAPSQPSTDKAAPPAEKAPGKSSTTTDVPTPKEPAAGSTEKAKVR